MRAVLRRAEQRQKGLGHLQQAEDVDLEHPAHLVQRHMHQRRRSRDARVVDQGGEPAIADLLLHLLDSARDRCRVGHVEQQRREVLGKLLLQALGIGLLSHTAEDVVTACDEIAGGVKADAGGYTGNQHMGTLFGFHLDSLTAWVASTPTGPGFTGQTRDPSSLPGPSARDGGVDAGMFMRLPLRSAGGSWTEVPIHC